MQQILQAIAAVALPLAMIAAFALAVGGIRLIVARRVYKQGALMLVMAAVLVANVLVWSV